MHFEHLLLDRLSYLKHERQSPGCYQGYALGGVLGCLIGFLLVFTWESIRAMRRIYRIHRFVETFPTVTEACFAYGEEEPVEDLCIVFTRETVEKAARKTGFYAG